MSTKRFLIALALAATTVPSLALDRMFPPVAKRGVVTIAVYPDLVIDERPRRLSVGARIWNASNRIDLPYALQGKQFIGHYTETANGEIDRIWILTPQELLKPAPAATPQQPPLPQLVN